MDAAMATPASVAETPDLDKLLLRPGYIVGPGFEHGPELKSMLHDDIRVLVVGAGGLGCELLKDLALSGIRNLDVIDMDTIDVSNLNRQFLFRPKDVGKPKAEVAAARIMERVAGVSVTPHFCRIEDKPVDWYRDFHVIALGLDSLEARSYINGVVCSFLEFEEDGTPDLSTVKPMVDGGTEGFKGHARVIIPGMTPCFQCTMWLFPPQTKFPLCTLAETPRTAAHCIEYAHLIAWGQERCGEAFDSDDPDHMKWVYDAAIRRAEHFGIPGVTLSHTQGVVKNIIPAIPSTNAIVASACALEVLKMVTMCSTGMNNYMMFNGTRGVYTHTVAYDRDSACPVCSAGVAMEMPAQATLADLVQELIRRFPTQLASPSVSHGRRPLYAHGIFEEETKANLLLPLTQLLHDEGTAKEEPLRNILLVVNDKKTPVPLRIRLSLT